MTQKKAILCVDDEKIVLDALKEQLTANFGYRYIYEVAENAQEAWEVIEDLSEEGVTLLLIVSDWLMPGIRGDEFLIQVHEKFPSISKIMLTGQADPKAMANAEQNANLKACLLKPWNEQELVQIIQSALE